MFPNENNVTKQQCFQIRIFAMYISYINVAKAVIKTVSGIEFNQDKSMTKDLKKMEKSF